MPRLSRGTSKVRIESVKPQHRILLLGTVTPVTVFREDQPDIAPDARQKLTSWIRSNLDRVARERQGSGNQTTLRRLTRYEYNNTMRDLLGLDLNTRVTFRPSPRPRMDLKIMAHLWAFRRFKLNITSRRLDMHWIRRL